jgi:hypothetical protein
MCTNGSNGSPYLLRARRTYTEVIRGGEDEARR